MLNKTIREIEFDLYHSEVRIVVGIQVLIGKAQDVITRLAHDFNPCSQLGFRAELCRVQVACIRMDKGEGDTECKCVLKEAIRTGVVLIERET